MTDEYFAWVSHFNTRETLNALGYAARDIAAMGLREIAKTVQQLERENRTFDTYNEREYNVTKLDDRRDNDGNHLHNERRSEYTGPRNTGRKRDEFRSLGDTQKELSDERKESSVRQSSDIMHIEQSLDGNTNSSREYDGEPDNKDEGTGESNRGIEGERSDAVDWADEQYQELSEGNSDERDNRKLSIYNSQTEAKELPFFNWNNIPEALRTVLDEKELIEVEKIITEEGDDKEEHLRNLFMKKASLSTEKYSIFKS